MKNIPKCNKCGATGVRIYRDYGIFRRPEKDRCNDCIDENHREWMVPCILDVDGSAWGYTSVPEHACKQFYAFPEKNSDKPYWKIRKDGAASSNWTDPKVVDEELIEQKITGRGW